MAAISAQVQAIVDRAVVERARSWADALDELDGLLAAAIDECDLDDHSRVQLQPGRVKSAGRLADKVQRRIDAEGIEVPQTVEEVEAAIDDIVATRIVCKTLRDITLVDEAIRRYSARGDSGLALAREPDDYVTLPKASGYRSLHHKLSVPFGETGGDRLVCEVQVRTRMQDAWGELTHENSYKTGGIALPPLHVALARHLADLLHEVDELANTLAVATDELRSDMERAEEIAASGRAADPRRRLTPGEIYLGTVVSTGRNYALVVVDEFRGLLGAWSIREALGVDGFVAASMYLQPGDSLKVEVKEHTDDRLVLLPADPRELMYPEHAPHRNGTGESAGA